MPKVLAAALAIPRELSFMVRSEPARTAAKRCRTGSGVLVRGSTYDILPGSGPVRGSPPEGDEPD